MVARVMIDRAESIEAIHIFGTLCTKVAAALGVIAFEWPTGIEGWQLPELQAIIAKHDLELINFHGCMFGLVSTEGVAMKKSWTVATNCFELKQELAAAKCNGGHLHIPIEGRLTELSGFYPKAMAQAIHLGLRKWWDRVSITVIAKPMQANNAGSMADHIRNNHRPFRRDCAACVAGSGRNRPHRRNHTPEIGVLSADLAGPIKEGEDGTRYFIIGVYVQELLVDTPPPEPEEPWGANDWREEPAGFTAGGSAADWPFEQVAAQSLHVWSRQDKDAVTFRGTTKQGPAWSSVVRKRTLDTKTGEVLDDLTNPQDTAQWQLTRRIPGGKRDITTEITYEAEAALSLRTRLRRLNQAQRGRK